MLILGGHYSTQHSDGALGTWPMLGSARLSVWKHVPVLEDSGLLWGFQSLTPHPKVCPGWMGQSLREGHLREGLKWGRSLPKSWGAWQDPWLVPDRWFVPWGLWLEVGRDTLPFPCKEHPVRLGCLKSVSALPWQPAFCHQVVAFGF